MSKERELLKRVWASEKWDMPEDLQIEIKELLAEPEPEPTTDKQTSVSMAVMPNGVSVSNVYDAYEAGRASVMVEPEPDYYLWFDEVHEEHPTNEGDPDVFPLYLSPPKQEPFGPEKREKLSKAYNTKAEQVAFEEGIIFAEISHGIGE